MKTCIISTTLSIIITCIVACSTSPRDLRDFYFPVRELTDGQVYVYTDPTQPDRQPSYWYYLGRDLDTALYLSATSYGPDFEPAQQVVERIFNDGVVVEQLALNFPDSMGQSRMLNATVKSGNVFPFYLDQEAPPAYIIDLAFALPKPEGARQLVTFNRQYSRDTSLQVMGQIYEALVFKVVAEYYLEEGKQGGVSTEVEGFEIYARDLGLVETKRVTTSGTVLLHDKLSNQMTMDDLIELSTH